MKKQCEYRALVWALKIAVFFRGTDTHDGAVELAVKIASPLSEKEVERARKEVENDLYPVKS